MHFQGRSWLEHVVAMEYWPLMATRTTHVKNGVHFLALLKHEAKIKGFSKQFGDMHHFYKLVLRRYWFCAAGIEQGSPQRWRRELP
jgi:hypothetical protein